MKSFGYTRISIILKNLRFFKETGKIDVSNNEGIFEFNILLGL